MKNSNLVRLLSLIIAVTILAGCSKDEQLISKTANTNEKAVMNPPIYGGGFITGQLYPVPDFCTITVYDVTGFSKDYKTGDDGSFKIGYIPEGIYYLRVTYVFQTGELGFPLIHIIPDISVKNGEVTALGPIKLPQIL